MLGQMSNSPFGGVCKYFVKGQSGLKPPPPEMVISYQQKIADQVSEEINQFLRGIFI